MATGASRSQTVLPKVGDGLVVEFEIGVVFPSH